MAGANGGGRLARARFHHADTALRGGAGDVEAGAVLGDATAGGGDAREAELLAGAYRESLRLAEEKGCVSVALPAISTGAGALSSSLISSPLPAARERERRTRATGAGVSPSRSIESLSSSSAMAEKKVIVCVCPRSGLRRTPEGGPRGAF